MRIVFLGTPDFAVKSLSALIGSAHEVAGVVTQPDRPAGRGNTVQMSPVKELALRHNIPVYQFQKIRAEGEQPLKELRPDIMVTCAYGQILTQNILEIAPHGIINVHASLLPKYRGAAPIQWAIINGDAETGVTIMRTEAGIDTGDILHVKKLAIGARETAGELFDRLSVLGSEALLEALDGIERGVLHPVKQDEAQATHVKMLCKTDGLLNWERPARSLFNLIRGVNPWPGAFTYHCGKMLKIWESTPVEGAPGVPGEVVASDARSGLIVACGEGWLRLDVLQEAGGRRMTALEYLRGKAIPVGSVFANA